MAPCSSSIELICMRIRPRLPVLVPVMAVGYAYGTIGDFQWQRMPLRRRLSAPGSHDPKPCVLVDRLHTPTAKGRPPDLLLVFLGVIFSAIEELGISQSDGRPRRVSDSATTDVVGMQGDLPARDKTNGLIIRRSRSGRLRTLVRNLSHSCANCGYRGYPRRTWPGLPNRALLECEKDLRGGAVEQKGHPAGGRSCKPFVPLWAGKCVRPHNQ